MARPFISDNVQRYAAAYEAAGGYPSASFSNFKIWPFVVLVAVGFPLLLILPLWLMIPIWFGGFCIAAVAANEPSYKKKPVVLTEREREVVARVSSIRLGSLFLLVPLALFAFFALLVLICPA